ncbi:Hypothetical protein FKW44_010490 [Caligus rogercresseyi]|uniref:Uncharacterized protein n=1 Tax=Caligus rogercresseyi TaxID=217165 RepID=A0A7T8K7D8_CALRO|nr:Hypothetical protein FKW44_010490 [Caligus rogercresseyi]
MNLAMLKKIKKIVGDMDIIKEVVAIMGIIKEVVAIMDIIKEVVAIMDIIKEVVAIMGMIVIIDIIIRSTTAGLIGWRKKDLSRSKMKKIAGMENTILEIAVVIMAINGWIEN